MTSAGHDMMQQWPASLLVLGMVNLEGKFGLNIFKIVSEKLF